MRTGLFAVLHAANSLEARVEARLADVGLSLPKLAALHQLSQAGDSLPLGQLAERLACVKSNVTQLVDRLEADGLVRRVEDPEDRRAVRAAVTALGKERYAAGVRQVERVQAEFAETLSGIDQGALERVLSAIR